jgi:glycerophosphoryl diester phosphodiesterase
LNFSHRYGLRVVAWTVNSREDALRLVDVGVDGLASDIPGELVELRKELQLSK